jgi:hypothetical protein
MAAEIKIHLRFNKVSGKKDIIIEYDSEDDALPYEHEERHWELVEELVGKGILDPNDVGQLRVGKAGEEPAPVAAPDAVPAAEAEGSG